jgi:hypothetical protein
MNLHLNSELLWPERVQILAGSEQPGYAADRSHLVPAGSAAAALRP